LKLEIESAFIEFLEDKMLEFDPVTVISKLNFFNRLKISLSGKKMARMTGII